VDSLSLFDSFRILAVIQNSRFAMNDRHVISPYPIRMPPELRQRLEESAKQGSRSLHSEIISRLEASYDPDAFIDMAAGVPDEPGFSNDPTVQAEVRDIKKQFQLFQEMIELLREPPTSEQIAWAEIKMAEMRERHAAEEDSTISSPPVTPSNKAAPDSNDRVIRLGRQKKLVD